MCWVPNGQHFGNRLATPPKASLDENLFQVDRDIDQRIDAAQRKSFLGFADAASRRQLEERAKSLRNCPMDSAILLRFFVHAECFW
jgi:hypothetical protein